MSPATFVIIVLIVLVVILAAVWGAATRIKRRIESRRSLPCPWVTPCGRRPRALRLRALSADPVC